MEDSISTLVWWTFSKSGWWRRRLACKLQSVPSPLFLQAARRLVVVLVLVLGFAAEFEDDDDDEHEEDNEASPTPYRSERR